MCCGDKDNEETKARK